MPLSKERNRARMRQARLHAKEVQPDKERHIRLPFRIYRRDSFTCQYCGRTPQDGIKLELDHIIPRSSGGDGNDGNLITSCWECNSAKSNVSLVQPNIPLYNPAIHKPGDTVRVLRGRRELIVTIPKLDADGNAIPSY